MTESARTIAYAAVAVVSVIVAGAYSTFTAPAAVEGFSLVGKEFYPDFKDPRTATSMRLAAFDGDSAKQSTFEIEQKDGNWIIPSHFDYPADARERLNKTGNSIIGIKRGPQKATRASEHKDLGVLDPLEEEITEFEGRGKRITLKNGKGDVLVDYIVGKKFKDDGDLYYVRTPGENEVYLAEIDVDVSTKFSDWIEDDLLKLNGGDLRELTVNKLSIDEVRRAITGQEVNILKRDKSVDPWELDGLNEETEEVRKAEIDGMVSALDDLKILAVRPKPEGLNADLTVKPGMSQGLLNFLQVELQSKGFFITGGEKAMLLANEGNLQAATEAGVVYTLNFGEIFSGSEDEIQFGSTRKEEKATEDADKKEDQEEAPDPLASTDLKQSRYLFVTAAFDQKYLGDIPTKPEEPKRPEGLKDEEPAEADEQKKEDGDEAKEEKPEPDEAAKKAAEEQTKLRGEWEAAQAKYKSDLRTYEQDLKDYEQKVEDGKKTVDELNNRFGAWYYVISGESFETLRLARADLVKAKEKKPEDAKADAPQLPNANKPEAKPAENPAGAAAEKKPAVDTPKTEQPAKTAPADAGSKQPAPAAKGTEPSEAASKPAPEPEKPDPAKKAEDPKQDPPKADPSAAESKPKPKEAPAKKPAANDKKEEPAASDK